MAKSKVKGIYAIKIGEKYYIGKDTEIFANKRLKEHLALLRKNSHYNSYLQNAYNKYGEKSLIYIILTFDEQYTLEELTELERYYIKLFDSHSNGYNLTIGGEGLGGFKCSQETINKRSELNSGERNANAKITNKQFFEIVELFKQGKKNEEIAAIYHLHPRYVSLIRHKKRFKKLWELVEDYEPEISKGNYIHRKLTEQQFIELVHKIKSGATNAELEKQFNLGSGVVSRIRHKHFYKDWWKKHFNE
jgi:hypothetical protein